MSIQVHSDGRFANAPTVLRPLAWFTASLIVALALLGVGTLRPELQLGVASSIFARTAIYVATLTGLWLSLGLVDSAPAERLRHWLVVALPVTLWLAAIYWLALTDAFRPRPAGWLPTPIAIFMPMLIGLPLLLRSNFIGAMLDRMPGWWLIAIQAYRVLGATFLVGWVRGDLSILFAVPAGIGDVSVGLLAIPSLSARNRMEERVQIWDCLEPPWPAGLHDRHRHRNFDNSADHRSRSIECRVGCFPRGDDPCLRSAELDPAARTVAAPVAPQAEGYSSMTCAHSKIRRHQEASSCHSVVSKH
jgi:hypothetical protein